MAIVSFAPGLKQQYFDSNGNPLAGGSIYTYRSGTSTPQATYIDSTGVVPNANPIVLDANGEANIWLDVSLSYKFVIKDSGGTTLRTLDGVVGLATNNSVVTASIQDRAVTTAKIAPGAVTAVELQSDATFDSNRPVNTNSIRNGSVTHEKVNAVFGFLPPTTQTLTSTASSTYNKTYLFFVASGNATAGATYTNNGVTFTVVKTISSGAILQCTGPGAPASTGVLTKSTGTGDSAMTFSIFAAPIYLRVKMVGGGGGAGGSGAGGSTGNGTDGTASTFATLTANGGGGAPGGGSGATSGGGTGGTASLGSGPIGLAIQGSPGGGGGYNGSSVTGVTGGNGGQTPFGGAGNTGSINKAGYDAVANTGSGGGGAASKDGVSSSWASGGGGAGGYIDAIISNPSATYTYAVGAKGTGGSAGGGWAGGSGADGVIFVEEHYQ